MRLTLTRLTRQAESVILKVAAAESCCGRSYAITLLNILFEPREAKPHLRGDAFYAEEVMDRTARFSVEWSSI